MRSLRREKNWMRVHGGVALCVLCLQLLAVRTQAAQPNIILCMTDDQGWGDTGYNGHPHLKTPHLDQMSKEGITFSRFYSGAAMCSPTRGSCYTGRSPYRFGITFAMQGRLEATEIPITTVLKKQGYTTGHFGKWHMGTLSKKKGDQKRWGGFSGNPARYYCPPWERDVDVCFVTESKVPTWDPMVDPGRFKRGVDNPLPDPATAKRYGNEYFTGPDQKPVDNLDGDDSRVIMDRAIPFIRGAVKKKQPFLAVVWFHTPHSPVVGGPRHREMYNELSIEQQHYYGCITAMDEQVGRLRAELKRLGVDKNTMLWFCSDNGPARQGSPRQIGSNGGLSGHKLSIKEGGIRVPGLLVWPDVVKASRTIDVPCFTSDYFPTILDAIKVPLPSDRPYDGISLMPLVRGKVSERGTPFGVLNAGGNEAVWFNDRHKLIMRGDRIRLFDIPEDPGEKKDLASELPELAARMKAEVSQWKAGVMKDLAAVK